MDGRARTEFEARQAWLAHQDALTAWQKAREDARLEAWQAAYDSARRARFGNSEATEKAHQAAREAVAEFERRTPEPVFQQPAVKSSWLNRLVGERR